MRNIVRRSLAAVAVVSLTAGTAACGNDEPDTDETTAGSSSEDNEEAGDGEVDDIDNVDTDDDADDNGLAGLEVTAVGNVSELLSGEAMRIDRDGLGTSEEDQGEVGIPDGEWEYDYDYDYFDYDYLTEYDDDYGEDLTEEGVLVVSADGLQDWAVDDAVRVSGTVRRFDQETIESLYEIDLEDDVFDPEENSLVIVADSVQAATAPAASGGSGGGTGDGSSTG